MILDQLKELLELHGVNTQNVERIDIAIDLLLQTERNEHSKKVTTSEPDAPRRSRERRDKSEPTA